MRLKLHLGSVSQSVGLLQVLKDMTEVMLNSYIIVIKEKLTHQHSVLTQSLASKEQYWNREDILCQFSG